MTPVSSEGGVGTLFFLSGFGHCHYACLRCSTGGPAMASRAGWKADILSAASYPLSSDPADGGVHSGAGGERGLTGALNQSSYR